MRGRVALKEGQEPVGPRRAVEAIGLREVERQVVSQDTMPQLSFRPRDDIVGFRQLLDVVRPLDQRIVVELFSADPEHVQDDLRVLRIVLVPAIV